MKVAQYLKAIAAALTAAAGTYVGVAADGVTLPEWALVVASGIAALGIVWAVPNAPKAQP